jgi:hypothetical protein
MQPIACRFWEKVGLGPLGGSKPVTAFVLFEEDSARGAAVEGWLQRVASAYTVRLEDIAFVIADIAARREVLEPMFPGRLDLTVRDWFRFGGTLSERL